LQGLTTERRICQADPMTNESNPTRARFALLRDQTDGDGCQNDEQGADIAFALLEDDGGSPVAWARVVHADVAESGAYSAYDHMDGDAPEWSADSCPDFDDANIVSLGCGGSIGLEFVDDDGATVEMQTGRQKLRVGEFGAQCEEDPAEDVYEVFLCPGAQNPDELPDACTLSVGSGRGERAFEF
jgi:hypothetical protein